jgi:hypothetical protein
VKGTEPRPIIAYVIVLLIIIVVVTNQELFDLLPPSVIGVGIILASAIISSVIKDNW